MSNIKDTRFDQKSPALSVPVVDGGDNIHYTTHIKRTLQLIDCIGLRADSVKIRRGSIFGQLFVVLSPYGGGEGKR